MTTAARDVLYAFRTFARAPLATFTIIATIAVGLGLVGVVFTFYSAIYLRRDAVSNPHELFEVRRPPHPGARAYIGFNAKTYPLIRDHGEVFAGTFARMSDVATRVEGQKAAATLVTAGFFDVLGVRARSGRTLNTADDAGEPAIVLSDTGWTRLLARDENAIGRRVAINGRRFVVAGVMPDGFRGLAVRAPDFWAPLSAAGLLVPAPTATEAGRPMQVIGRLKPGLTESEAEDRLTAWAGGHPDLQTGRARSRATIVLEPREGTMSAETQKGLQRFAPLFIAFGLVLLIGCANVANLLLARGLSRQREIGIRLSLGASRGRLLRQLLTESLLLALAAAACGFVVTRLALTAAVRTVVGTLPPELVEYGLTVPAADWRVLAFLAGAALVATAMFGLMPALQATRVQLVQAVKGEVSRDARPGRARNLLIALQVGASALLLICAVVFLRGALGAASFDHGIRTADTIVLNRFNESLRPAIVAAVTSDPLVAGVAASSPAPLSLSTWTEVTAEGGVLQPIDYKLASPSYLDVLGIPVVRGRAFTPGETSAASGVAMLSEGGARRLWPDGDALGRTLRIDVDPRRPSANAAPAGSYTVVGIVRDVHASNGFFPEPRDLSMYLPASPSLPGTSLTMRVHGDPEEARRQLLERLTAIDPALGDVRTMRAATGVLTYVLSAGFWIVSVLGVLALALTLSGLFSVLSYMVEQRRQEIGVRVALGATSRHVAWLVLSQSFMPVALGLAAGGILAGSVATLLLRSRAADMVQAAVHVLDPVAYAGSFIAIVLACATAAAVPALRASRLDPIATLRRD